MSFLEEGVGKLLDRVADRQGGSLQPRAVVKWLGDIDPAGGKSDGRVASMGLDVLDLSGIAIAVEADGDDDYAGGGGRVEESGNVGGKGVGGGWGRGGGGQKG